ncbi:class I SAM-dependent methyltransferase [Candidatus Margulisiibacteriota bacterium]
MIKKAKQLIKEALIPLGLSELASKIYNYTIFLPDIKLHYNNLMFRLKGASDKLPLPPTHLIFFVGGFNINIHYNSGVEGAICIKNALMKNGLDIKKFNNILDFGCGLGRIMRQWKTLEGPKLYGTDYNPRLIKWCKKSFPFAEFKTNILSPNLTYESNKFDFIYVISVFTHLDEKLQYGWIDELTRILNPGGYLLITLKTTTSQVQLSPEQKKEFNEGKLVILHDEYPGTNFCGVHHPEKFVREKLCKNLKIIDFIPNGSTDTDQDIYLIQKPMK